MQLTKHWAATLDDYAIDLAWSPDGSLLAAASAAGPVSLFAATDGAKRHELPGHEQGTIRYLVYNGGAPKYVAAINAVAASGYEGVVLSADRAAPPAGGSAMSRPGS